MRKIWRRRSSKRETPDSSFRSIIENLIDANGGTIHIFRQDTEGVAGLPGFFLQEGEVKDWKGTDIEPYLKNQYGGGIYNVQLHRKEKDGTERQAGAFKYQIDGEPKEARFEVTKRKDKERAEIADIFKISMEFAKDLKSGDSGNSALIQALILQNTELQKLNSSNMMDMQKQYNQLVLKISSDKEAGGGMSEMIDNMMHMEEFKSMLQPKLETNETVELIKALPSVATAIAAWKTGAMPPQEPVRMIEAAHPGETQDVNLGAPQPTNRGTPSGTKEATPSEIKLPNGTKIERDEFEIVMLDPLVDQINAGATPQEIALMIKTIIDWSFWRVKSGVEPHPAIFGMVSALAQASQGKADIESVEKAYNEFVKNIEMPAKLIEPVKQELVSIYGPLLVKMQSQANLVPPGDGRTKAGGVEDAELGKK